MSKSIFSTLEFHGQALTLRSARQTALASNIANVDTPGFKARDLDFAKELDRASGGRASRDAGTSGQGTTALQVSTSRQPVHAGHIPLSGNGADGGNGGTGGNGIGTSGAGTSRMLYRRPEQAAIDGNTVDLDRERAVFADNSLHYEATLRFINGHVRTMTSAIKGE